MRPSIVDRVCRPSVLGLLVGIVTSVATAGLVFGATAVARTEPATPGAVLEATHLPPLLVGGGEPVKLAFDVHCAEAGVEDPEESCSVGGSLFVRSGSTGAFRALPLAEDDARGISRLAAMAPEAIAASSFEYYADIRARESGSSLRVPSGADATYRSYVVRNPVEIDLAPHPFGSTRRGVRVVSAPWGDGPTEVGLESGRTAHPVGASSFDVDPAGTVVLLDEAHRRVLRFSEQREPVAVPLSIDGSLADLALGDDASMHILESVAPPGKNPVVRRFDHDGRQLDVIETAEPSSSQIRIGPDGPLVLEHPSHRWMPVAIGGSPVSRSEQLRRGSVGRRLRSGGEVVVLRTGNELRLALVARDRVQTSWRLRSAGDLAEVQLAEALGNRLVVVVRIYDDDSDEFRVLVLDRRGLVQQFSVASADWAETAPLSRFRLAGRSLYQLGSDPTGAFVHRYDLEVR